ncbi:ribosome biogenesis GTP-binding protein YihA/YsxC [Pyruvatibacter sp.]|uniref:ribosome biogenesis GTP-binding protein YihA/YsxC n=1 Tax=Pyruvatibacter sp. TaxID=1981328 RepID=UPI0032F05A0F
MANSDEAEAARLTEAGRLLFAQPVAFVKGVVNVDGLPPGDRPEFAFAGRSNVGKSSLINALTNRKDLARTSNTPGRTQEINFFALPAQDPDSVYLVDLPGYGYARESKSKVRTWTSLITRYLAGRASLRRVFVLIDSRHGVKANDEEIFTLMDTAAVSYQVVLTKADKPKRDELEAVIAKTEEIIRKHVAAFPQVLVTASRTGAGLEDVRSAVAQLREH